MLLVCHVSMGTLFSTFIILFPCLHSIFFYIYIPSPFLPLKL